MIPKSYPVSVPLSGEMPGLFRALGTMRRNVLSLIPQEATREPILSGKTGARWHMVIDPAGLQQVLKDNSDNYPKAKVSTNPFRLALAGSLYLAEGADWHKQRRATAHAFTPHNMMNLSPIMEAAAQSSLKRIEAAGEQPMDLHEEMALAMVEVFTNVTLAGRGAEACDEIKAAVRDYVGSCWNISFLDLMGLPCPRGLAAQRKIRRMRKIADEAIARSGREKGVERPDLLDLLRDGAEKDCELSAEELRRNVLSMIMTGHETATLTLAWAMYLCAYDPAVQAIARQEAQAVLQGRVAEADDLGNLPFCRMIIDEALRLYPPVSVMSRAARAPDRILGREVEKGDLIILPIYALHRSERIWNNPSAFDPTRFRDLSRISRFVHLPFGAGPRACLGATFAIQQAVIVLATLLSRRRFEMVPGRVPEPVMRLTLRPKGGVWMTSEPAPWEAQALSGGHGRYQEELRAAG